MSQADGYIRIVTKNDVSEAEKSTEQLGDTIAEAMDTAPVDQMKKAFDGLGDAVSNTDISGVDDLKDSVNAVGSAAVSTGDLIKANLISDVVMQGVQRLASALKEVAVDSVSGAIGNETAFAKVKTLLKGDDVQRYYEDLIDISNRTGVAFEDLAESMYSALSAGVPQDNVLSFIESSVALSKGGFTSAATSIDVVTTALNAYQMEMSEAAHIQNVLITTQNLGKTTVDELASAMGKVIPTAKAVNVSFDQLGAMYATVTANGVATAESTTYLNAMLDELGKSGSTAEKAMMQATEGTELAGKKFSEISAIGYDITDVLKLMSDDAQEAGLALSDMFSSSEGAKAANILLSNIEGFKSNIDAMVESAGAATDAAATMMDTTAEKAQIANNQIENMSETIAQSLLPTIGDAAEKISDTMQTSEFKETAEDVGEFISGTLVMLIDHIDLAASAISGVTAAVITFKTVSVLTKVVASWQTAALQVTLFSQAQGAAALKTAALNGTLTTQELIYAVLSGKLDIATVKQYALNTAMSLNPAGLVAAAVGLLATALVAYSLNAKEATAQSEELADAIQAVDDIQKSIDDSIKNGEAELDILQKKVDRYEELRTAVNLTADEHAILKGLSDDLQGILGDEVSVVNSLTGEYNDLTDAVSNYISKKRDEITMQAYEDNILNIQKQYAAIEADIAAKKERYEKLNWFGDDKTDWNGEKPRGEVDTLKAETDALEAEKARLDAELDRYWNLYENRHITDNVVTSATAGYGDYSSVNYLPNYYATLAEEYDYWSKAYKHDYDMGLLSAAEYYEKLARLRDEYLAPDSDEWRSVSVELKKYYDSLSVEQQKAIDEAAKARTSAYNDEKSQLQFRLKTNQITEKQYYTELAKIRDKYLDKNSSEWRSAYLEAYQYNQQLLQTNKDALTQLLSDASDTTLSALENITAARDSLSSKLMDFNKTFEKIKETVPETIAVKGNFTITTAEHEIETYRMGADSIEDNIKVLEEYGAMLDALKARGADESTLNDILAMDVDEALEFGGKLLNMSDKEWNAYFDSMAKLRQTAADISAKYYQNEVESLRDNFIDKLRSELDGLGADMYNVGADVAAEFVSGWNEALGTKDLTIGELMRAVSGGTLDTAPKAAQQLVSAGNVKADADNTKTEAQKIITVPIYIGTKKIAEVMVDATNGEIIRTGKNVLLT